MDDVTNADRQHRIKVVMEEIGVDEETASFAVALADRKGAGDIRAITFPLPEAEARRQIGQLVDSLGFTPDEATRYVAGDRTAIEAVAARRRAAEENSLAAIDSRTRASKLSAD